MRRRTVLLATILVAGCMVLPEHQAAVECICRPGVAPVYRLFLQERTGRWGCSPHSGFYSETAWFAIRLPEEPKNRTRYEASRLEVTSESGSEPTVVPVIGGFVEIDLPGGRSTVTLTTASGEFWANGTYPTHKR